MTISFEVEIEDCRTWPMLFSIEADKNRELIIGFHKEQKRIDRLCQEDILLKINRPVNDFEIDYQALVDRLEKILIVNIDI